jgi:hypothetical protein
VVKKNEQEKLKLFSKAWKQEAISFRVIKIIFRLVDLIEGGVNKHQQF